MCSVAIPGDEFAIAVEQVSPSCSPEDHLATEDRGLAGIVVEFGEGASRMVATDKFRLAARSLSITASTGELPPYSGIIPMKAMREAARIASDSGPKHVEIELSEDGQARFCVGGEVRIARLMLASYPDSRSVLRETYTWEVRVEREALAATLGRLAPRARRLPAPRVELVLRGDAVEVSVEDARLKRGEARERIAAKSGSAEEMRMHFNPDKLIDGLVATNAVDVILGINGPLKPVLIAPAAADGEKPNFRYLIMPMRGPAYKVWSVPPAGRQEPEATRDGSL